MCWSPRISVCPFINFCCAAARAWRARERGELTGKALESLGADFPLHLYEELIAQYQDAGPADRLDGHHQLHH